MFVDLVVLLSGGEASAYAFEGAENRGFLRVGTDRNRPGNDRFRHYSDRSPARKGPPPTDSKLTQIRWAKRAYSVFKERVAVEYFSFLLG
jgi:hypothetical protein